MILRQLKSEIALTSVNNIVTGTADNVSSASIATILTLAPSETHKVVKISCSGPDYAKFQIFIDTVLFETKRSGPKRNIDFIFDYPILINSGQVLDVKVTHFYTGDQIDFEGTLYSIK